MKHSGFKGLYDRQRGKDKNTACLYQKGRVGGKGHEEGREESKGGLSVTIPR